MTEVDTLLPHRIAFAQGEDPTQWLPRIPARWAVALLADEAGKPVQLLCLKNLRDGLRNRMLDAPAGGRVNWRELIRTVHYQPVDSRFEADWIYLQAAREFFPQTCDKLIGWAETWFVHVDSQAPFPRYIKTSVLTDAPGLWIGPLPDKNAAARLIELIEDAFDLCRYHHILVQYPNGKPCAYKEMGKCPAPCDGSISIEQYHRLIELSIAGLTDPARLIAEQTRRMEQAAARHRFEIAARIKAYILQLHQLGKGHFRHARPLADFSFVTVQPGPRPGQAKVFVIAPGQIDPILGLLDDPGDALEAICNQSGLPAAPAATEQIGLVARHLFDAKSASGAFIPLADLNERSLAAAYRLVLRQDKRTPDSSPSPGVPRGNGAGI